MTEIKEKRISMQEIRIKKENSGLNLKSNLCLIIKL